MGAPPDMLLLVPDVGVGPGPFPSPAWTLATMQTLTRLGLATNATEADEVWLLGAPVDTDPISLANPNVIGKFIGPGMIAADLIHASPCVYYALLRFVPPFGGVPTVGLDFFLIG